MKRKIRTGNCFGTEKLRERSTHVRKVDWREAVGTSIGLEIGWAQLDPGEEKMPRAEKRLDPVRVAGQCPGSERARRTLSTRSPGPMARWWLVLLLGLAEALAEAPLTYRLPEHVRPESYELKLLTNVTRGANAYEGHLILRLRVLRPTSLLALHAHELSMSKEKTKLQLISPGDSYKVIPVAHQEIDPEHQLFVLRFARNITPGGYRLDLHFFGKIRNGLFGFYWSSYRHNGEVKLMAVTQFSPTHARYAFPCMDEPSFKATFKLHVGHYSNETVTTNSLRESQVETSHPDYYITSFHRTPRMPTYVFGWAVHGLERVNSSNLRFWLWRRPPRRGETLTDFNSSSVLLREGPLIYDALERYMPLKNPVPMFQQIAVPDFNFMAMENWGMVTFREVVSFAHYGRSPPSEILNAIETIGHEYAHSWFGNLVTHAAWDVVWLKEGFATYFSYEASQAVHPNWPIQDVFTTSVLQSALRSDQLDHNLVMNGHSDGSPAASMDALNFVNYNKASSVIRMVADAMGQKYFTAAMHSYLTEMQYKAAWPEDLYRHLDQAAKSSPRPLAPVPFSRVLDTWASQPHYPLVRVFRVSPGCLRVTQEPFVLDRVNASSPKTRHWWWIPLRIASSSQPRGAEITWLGPKDLSVIHAYTWHLFNSFGMGFYRVTYSSENWQALADFLRKDDFNRITAASRATLLDDVFTLARAGYETYALALELARYLVREDKYAPWAAAVHAIKFLDQKLRGRPHIYDAFRSYVIDLITPIYQKLTFVVRPFDTYITTMHRSIILETACLLNLDDCISQAKSIFDDLISNATKPVAGYLKNFVYRVGAASGTDDDWRALWQRFLEEDEQPNKLLLISSLARTEKPYFIKQYFEYMLKNNTDFSYEYMIRSLVARSSKNIDSTLDYIQENFKSIIDTEGEDFFNSMFSVIGTEIFSEEQEYKLNEFIKRHENLLGDALEAAKIAIKSARDNIVWINIYAPQIESYLKCHNINCNSAT